MYIEVNNKRKNYTGFDKGRLNRGEERRITRKTLIHQAQLNPPDKSLPESFGRNLFKKIKFLVKYISEHLKRKNK
jgi:hypothetical protein